MKRSTPAGVAMMLGSVLVIITILFEYQIGWIGPPREAAAVPEFILSQWSSLKLIWSFQMLGHGLLALSYLLLFRESSSLQAAAWGALTLFALLVIFALGITLGGYEAALQVHATQPAVFEALRGSVRGLYSPGLFGGLVLFTLLYLSQTVAADGVVARRLGGVTLVLFGAALAIGAATPLTVKVTGATCFLLPLTMGYCLARPKNP